MESLILDVNITPIKMKLDREYLNIKKISNDLIVKKVKFIFENSKLKNLMILSGDHPNCNPKTGIVCLPDAFYDRNLFDRNGLSIKTVLEWLYYYNLVNCYFIPYGKIVYETLEGEWKNL